jgi:hypothetical protein
MALINGITNMLDNHAAKGIVANLKRYNRKIEEKQRPKLLESKLPQMMPYQLRKRNLMMKEDQE